MGLSGKLSAQIEIKSKADVFHELFRHTPHHLSDITPNLVKGCDLHHGNWGSPGSVICWKYIHDGKENIAKETIDIDEEKKSITMNLIEGDLLGLYESFITKIHVDTNGEASFVTWVFEYEKLNDDVEEPISLLQFVINVTKDIEAHHLKN